MNKVKKYSGYSMWLAVLAICVSAAGCKSGDMILGTGGLAVLAPTVTAVTPLDAAVGVSVSAPSITATFSEPMAPIGGSSSFTVKCAAPCADAVGTITFNGANTIATFNLAAGTTLAPTTLYTATITAARSIATGLPMDSPFVWTFTTGAPPDTTRPRVTSTQPVTTVPGPTAGVATNNKSITATFTEKMLPSTIDGTSFTVTCGAPCTNPVGTVTYTQSTRTAVFKHGADLEASTTYTATISKTVTDLAGNQLSGNTAPPPPAASDYVWTFTTAAAADAVPPTVTANNPGNASVGACVNQTINATFSEPMDPTTITTATFTLRETISGADVAGVVDYDSATQVASFNPSANLIGTPNTQYTVTIKGGATGVKDLAGNALAADNVTTFTTGSSNCALPPALGAAAPFGTLGGSAGMTNQGLLTVINGDIGTTAVSTAVTGFHDSTPGCTYTETPLNNGVVNGGIFTAPPPPTVACPNEGTAQTFTAATKARNDGVTAYNDLAGRPAGSDPGAGSLANLTLAPGTYTAAGGSFMIQGGDLTLDAQGNANAVWVFQMASSLTVGGPGAAFPQSVQLINGAQAKNVFWQVGTAATINAAGGGTMVGTIISQAGANISTAGNTVIVTLNGRVLSTGASVTLVNTVINVPGP